MALSPEEVRIRRRDWMRRDMAANPEKYRERNRKRYWANHEAMRERDRKRSRETKIEALTHYGNGTLACVCCKESVLEFLSLDHIEHNGGAKDRKNGHRGGRGTYRRVIVQGFPPGFQTLCHNCNLAKGFYGRCPHGNHQ